MILHVCILDKFIEPFYAFVEKNFADFDAKHQFFIDGTSDKYAAPTGNNVFLAHSVSRLTSYFMLIRQMNHAEKIILHGLWDRRILELLTVQPWLLKKCYWVIWGGDLYTRILSEQTLGWWRFEILRRICIRHIGHFITHISGDYELAQKWYGAEGVWHECFMYPSNLYHESPVQVTQHEGFNILLGNSADPSNNHIDALEKLRPYSAEDIRIFCPLSYGDAEYAKQVEDYGKSIFGDKFNPLLEFMRLDEYKKLLAKIDIAVFNHKRQQGMGNITTLLGMGKKVFMRSDITSYHTIRSLGAIVFDVECFNLISLEAGSASNNKLIISQYFSSKTLIAQLDNIFQSTFE